MDCGDRQADLLGQFSHAPRGLDTPSASQKLQDYRDFQKLIAIANYDHDPTIISHHFFWDAFRATERNLVSDAKASIKYKRFTQRCVA
jgi:hypothetical protein